jgi:hypothetical protein
MTWAKNITGREKGIFRTENGNADEMIAIGRITKAGFPCSRVDVTNAKYDAIVDLGPDKLLRIQIKGFSGSSVDFSGGTRSGQQISRAVASRRYKYTKADCDVFVAINSNNGDCYIIPIQDTKSWGFTKTISKLQKYRENWNLFTKYRRKSKS